MKYLIPIQWCIIGILLVLLLSGCTTNPDGHRMQAYNVADLGSTGIALTAVEGAVEANPLGWGLIPLKFGMVKYAEGLPCHERKNVTESIAGFWGGAAVNNLALLAYPPVAVPLGIVSGVVLYRYEVGRYDYGCDMPVEELVADILYFTDADPSRVRVTFLTESRSPNTIWDHVSGEWRYIPSHDGEEEDI